MQITGLYFTTIKTSPQSFRGEVTKPKDEKMSNGVKLGLALAGLAVVGLGGFLLHKKIKEGQLEDLRKTNEVKDFEKKIKEAEEQLKQYMPDTEIKCLSASAKLIISEKEGASKSDPFPEVLVIQTEVPEKARKITQVIAKMTDCRIKELDTPYENVLEDLKREFKDASDHFSKTKTRTFLFVKSLDSALPYDNPKEINKVIHDGAKDSHTTVIYPASSPKVTSDEFIKLFEEPKPAEPPPPVFKPGSEEDKKSKEVEKLLKESGEIENSFELRRFIDNYDTFNIFRQTIVAEKVGIKPPNGILDVTNGVMLIERGDKNLPKEFSSTEFVLDKLPKVLKLDMKKIVHDHKNPISTLTQIRTTAEESEKNFQKTQTRTLLYVENLGELLADDSDEGIDNIGKFNRFAQTCSEKYHITLVLATKDPDKLESSSIAPHRFGVKLNLT